jgi:hypothetical protein
MDLATFLKEQGVPEPVIEHKDPAVEAGEAFAHSALETLGVLKLSNLPTAEQ